MTSTESVTYDSTCCIIYRSIHIAVGMIGWPMFVGETTPSGLPIGIIIGVVVALVVVAVIVVVIVVVIFIRRRRRLIVKTVY